MKKYEEIYHDYKNAILNGTYKDGSRLPTEEQIARQYGTSRVPVQQAMNALIGNGLVKRIIGSGTFVTYASNLPGGKNCKTVFLVNELKLHSRDIFVSARFSNADASVEREVLEQLKNGEIMGLIVYSSDTTANIDLIYELLVRRMPLVFVDKLPNGLVCNCVMSDPIQAMHTLVGHLYEKGHRRIAMVTHDVKVRSSAFLRLEMGRLSMAQYGLELPDRYIKCSGRWEEEIIDLVSQSQPPTAIVFTAAVIANVCCPVFRRLGIRIPQDLSIVAHDDIKRFSQGYGLKLTSVGQDYCGIGRVAAERLYHYMVKPDNRYQLEYLPVTFAGDGESVKDLSV